MTLPHHDGGGCTSYVPRGAKFRAERRNRDAKKAAVNPALTLFRRQSPTRAAPTSFLKRSHYIFYALETQGSTAAPFVSLRATLNARSRFKASLR